MPTVLLSTLVIVLSSITQAYLGLAGTRAMEARLQDHSWKKWLPTLIFGPPTFANGIFAATFILTRFAAPGIPMQPGAVKAASIDLVVWSLLPALTLISELIKFARRHPRHDW